MAEYEAVCTDIYSSTVPQLTALGEPLKSARWKLRLTQVQTPKVSICTGRLGKEIQIAQLMHLRLKMFIVVTNLSPEFQATPGAQTVYPGLEITAASLDVWSSVRKHRKIARVRNYFQKFAQIYYNLTL